MIPVKSKIIDVWDETPDVKSFLIENTIGKHPLPGQFYEISVKGYGEIPISVASWKDGLLFSIKKAGYVTSAMHAMKKNDEIGIRGPYGKGFPIKENVTLIAGGIGLPPARSYIEYSLSNKMYKLQLLYGARSPQDLVYRDLLNQWKKYFDVQVTVDKGDENWKGNVGVVTTLFKNIKDRDSYFYLIGPTVMMKYAVLELEKMGIGPDKIYLSLERRMKCGIGICGHCNLGKYYVCKDGPVFKYRDVMEIPELFF